MKVIFICAPFRAKNGWEIERNVRVAEEAALKVWQAGFACVCPHTNTRFFHQTLPDKTFLDGIIEIMKRCDAVLVVGGSPPSLGSQSEIDVAKQCNIPVFYSVKDLWSLNA